MSKILTLKKKIILILSVLAVGFFMTAGFAFIARADGLTVTGEQFKMKGASVRYVDDTHGPGVKFHVLLNKDVFDGLSDSAKTGLKLCPEKLLGGETLASSTNSNIVDIKTEKGNWKVSDTDENMMELTVYVYDIPAANYGTDIKVAGYITDGGNTVYTEAVNDTYSLAYVAKAAAAQVADADKISQLEGYYKFKFKAYDLSGSLVDGEQTVEYGATLTQPTATSTLTCGWFNKAKTQKWDFAADTVQGNVSLYETKHDFNDNGVCENCGTNIRSLFMAPDGATSVLSVNAKLGVYEISSTATTYDAYAKISGEVLEALKELGYKTLTFTVKNPGQAVEDDWKTFKMAAENKNNLWKSETAIAFISATQIFDGGKKYTFTFDVETYAGKDVYIYVDKCKNYPTVVEIAEFYDYESPEAILAASDNSTIEYIDGKGWHVYASDTSQGGYYANMSGDVLKHYIDKGNVTLKVSFVNTFGLDGISTAGNSVNCNVQFLPKSTNGSETWGYLSKFISQLHQAEDGSYFATIDLTDSTYDFSKGMRIYMVMNDVGGASVGHTYISKIEFLNYMHKSLWLSASSTDNANIIYVEGKGWKIERKDKTKEWYCRIPAKFMSGNDTMKITYVNQFDGVANANTGNFVDTKSRIIPWFTNSTSEDWEYQTEYISGLPENPDGGYISTVDLADGKHDFTKDTRIYFENVGVSVSCGYISDIEFINHGDKSQWISASGNNSIVTYIDGKGWEIKSTDGNNWYCVISGEILQYYIGKGYTEMAITYVNQFDGVANTDEGNFVNTYSRILPYKVGGEEDWTYKNLHLQYVSGLPENPSGYYTLTVDLTGSDYDFTRDTKIYFENHDVNNKAVTSGYISDIEFLLPNA